VGQVTFLTEGGKVVVCVVRGIVIDVRDRQHDFDDLREVLAKQVNATTRIHAMDAVFVMPFTEPIPRSDGVVSDAAPLAALTVAFADTLADRLPIGRVFRLVFDGH
jgi:hypothetical protein